MQHTGCFYCHLNKNMIKQGALLVLLLAVTGFISCKKSYNNSVEIYLLKSFTVNSVSLGQHTVPVIKDAVLENTPLVKNTDILSYNTSDYTFSLKKAIPEALKNVMQLTAFAVVVNKQPVYYGYIRPLYLSSIVFGIATIMPGFPSEHQLRIGFFYIDNANMEAFDQRNTPSLINALKADNRLK